MQKLHEDLITFLSVKITLKNDHFTPLNNKNSSFQFETNCLRGSSVMLKKQTELHGRSIDGDVCHPEPV